MTTFNDTVITTFVTKGMERFEKIGQMGSQLGRMKAMGVDVSDSMNSLQKSLSGSAEELAVLNQSFKDTTRMTRDMRRLGPMFGFLFGGMQMQRIGNSILRFVLPPLSQIEGHVTDGTRKVNAMSASFEFLKFSMFETFTQTPLFKTFVDFIVSGSNALGEFTQKHPILTEILASVGAIAAVLGTLAIGAGIFNQFAMMMGYVGESGKLIKGLNKVVDAANLARLAVIGIGVPVVFDALIDGFNFLNDDEFSMIEHLVNGLQLAAGTTAIGWAVGGPSGAAIGLTVGVGISFFITAIDWIMNKTKYSAADEFGLTKAQIDEIAELGSRPEMTAAFFNLQQGTVVPENARQSWIDYGDTISSSAMIGSDSIQTNLIDTILPNLNTSVLGIGTTTQTEIIDRWENWTPSTKTLTIKVKKEGSDDGPDFSPQNYSGTAKQYMSSIRG